MEPAVSLRLAPVLERQEGHASITIFHVLLTFCQLGALIRDSFLFGHLGSRGASGETDQFCSWVGLSFYLESAVEKAASLSFG